MMNFDKIKEFRVLLACLVIVAHAFVPHHHHFDDLEDHFNNSEQFSKTSNHQSDSETHCHAFNNLIIQSIDSFKELNTDYLCLSVMNFSDNLLSLHLLTDELIEPHVAQQIVIPKQFVISHFSLRGPPSLLPILS